MHAYITWSHVLRYPKHCNECKCFTPNVLGAHGNAQLVSHRVYVVVCCLQVATISAVSEEALPGGNRLWLGNLVGSYVSYVSYDLTATHGTEAAPSQQGQDEL